MASSKTARRSTPQGPAGKFQPDASASRIIPLGGGAFAYVLTPEGKTIKHTVASDEFMAALVEYANALGVERVKRDLNAVSIAAWAEIPAKLDAALAPAE
jgi:hypothetical protein